MPVSQFDISEFLGDLFHGHAVTRKTLIAVARSRGARPAVVDVLRNLRHPAYRHCCDLMADVADLPAAFDPWDVYTVEMHTGVGEPNL